MAKHDNNPYLDPLTHMCRKFDDTRGIILIPGWKVPKLVRLDFVQELNEYIDNALTPPAPLTCSMQTYAHGKIEHAAHWLFNKGISPFGVEAPEWIPAYVRRIVKRDWVEA